MTISQLIERLKLMDRPEAKVIVYNSRKDIFEEIISITAHKAGDVEVMYE